MARIWTDEQKLAFETRDKTLLVSAAAGSGKTAVLTERIVRSLLDEQHPADLSRMLIVTFTNAAAAEMRSRITSAIKEALGERPDDQHLEEQLLLIDSASICTIDSFCASFLRRNAGAAGISPRFRIADEAESEILSRAVWSSLLDDCYKSYRGEEKLPVREDFLLLCDSLASVRDENALLSHLSKLAKDCDSLFNGIHTLRSYAEEMQKEAKKDYPSTAAFAVIADRLMLGCTHFRDAYQRLLACAKEENSKRLSYLSDKGSLFGRLAEAFESKDLRAVRDLLTDELWKKSLPQAGKDKSDPLTAGINSDANDFRKEKLLPLTVFSEQDWQIEAPRLARVLDALATLCEAFDLRFRREKRARNVLTYADVERMTLDLLWDEEGQSALALTESTKYDYIYIDEYQDVSEVQHRIFELLSCKRNRFMVGDIKQSIYRFRGGEPSLFADLRADFDLPPFTEDGDAYTVFMSRNFRCDPPIIDFTNAVFDRLFGIAGKSIGYREEDRLVAGKEIGGGECAPVDILLAQDASGEFDGADEKNANAIFSMIKDLLDHGKKRNGEQIEAKDIAVLLRSVRHSSARKLSELLTDAGIPCTVPEDTDFFLSPEVLLLLCLLHAIDNPRRDIYLAGLLRSPLCGFTLDELITLRREGRKNACLYEALCDYAKKHPSDEKSTTALRMLDDYAAYAEGTSVASLLRRIFDETAMLALSVVGSGRENLQLFYHHAKHFEGSSFKGLYAFLAYIDRLIREGKHLPADAGAVSEASGVRIMTVHASKGLEFPVVILGDAGKPTSGGKLGVILHDKHVGACLRLCTDDRCAVCDNPLYTAARLASERADREEDLRLLYVALTRATERLCIVGCIGKKLPQELLLGQEIKPDLYSITEAKSYLSLVLMSLGISVREDETDTTESDVLLAKNAFFRIFFRRIDEYVTDPIAEALPCVLGSGDGTATALPSDSELRARFDFVYPHEAMVSLPAKLSVSRLYPDLLDEENETELKTPTQDTSSDKEQEAAPTRPRFMKEAEEATSAARGSATHLFLQFCDFHRLKEDARGELSRLVSTGFMPQADADMVRLHEIEAMTDSRLFADILAASKVYRELRFHAYLPASYFTEDQAKKKALEGETVFVQGVIDCVLVYEDGSYDLIDYKTDRLPKSREEAAAILRDRHTLQLSYYAEACERMFGKPPQRLRLFALAIGEDVLLERRTFDGA